MWVHRDRPDSLLASQRGCRYDSFATTQATDDATETSPLFERYPPARDGNSEETAMMLDKMRRDSDVISPFPRRSYSKVVIMFGVAVLIGVLVWIGTYTYALTADRDRFYSFAGDDDHYYDRHLFDMLPVPLMLGSFNAQDHADHARDGLYLDPDAKHKHHRHHKNRNTPYERLLGDAELEESDVLAPEGCEGTVILLRHCEKGHIREHCNYLGYERSVYLASLFGEDHTTRWPAPSYIFAERPGMRRNPNKQNFREVETVLPLSEKFDIKIDSEYSSLDTSKLARKIHGMFRSGEMCGKVIVIAWKHSKLPRIAQALGCARNEGCPTHYRGRDFDALWQLKFAYRTPLHSEHKSLKPPKAAKWMVFGSPLAENFDPLAFSKQVGDYPAGGTKTGGRWRSLDHEIPEREYIPKHKKKKYTSGF